MRAKSSLVGAKVIDVSLIEVEQKTTCPENMSQNERLDAVSQLSLRSETASMNPRTTTTANDPRKLLTKNGCHSTASKSVTISPRMDAIRTVKKALKATLTHRIMIRSSELGEGAWDLAVMLFYQPIRMRFVPFRNLHLSANPDLALHQRHLGKGQ
jgi:hypothetical protein